MPEDRWTPPVSHAYAGTSNPYSKKIEHPNTNAILKFGVVPGTADYGKIVGHYKGLVEQYRPELREAVDPVCDAVGE